MKNLILITLSALLFASCGSGSQENTTTDESTDEAPVQSMLAPDIMDPEGADVVLELKSDDQMKYDKSELRVSAGQKVKVVLRHVGKMDKSVMGHNFVLLGQGVDVSAFASLALGAVDNGYIPAETADVIAYTKVIGGGEETSVIFDAPAPGEYDFICSFPAHYEMMNGKFIVE